MRVETKPGSDMAICHVEVGDSIGLIDKTGRITDLVPVEALPADVVLVVPKHTHLTTVGWGIFRDASEPPLMWEYVDGLISPGDNVHVNIPAA